MVAIVRSPAAATTVAFAGRAIFLSTAPLFLAALLMPGTAHAASAGPQPSMTGVPAIGKEAAEGTCVQCHNNFPVNPDQDGVLTVEGVPAKYEPGKTYALTLRIANKDATRMRWGFQMTAIAMKDGEGAGVFTATDAGTTQVIESMMNSRTYIEHNINGTAIGQAGGNSWTFDWTAPKTDVGKVGFFAASNCANADGSNQGDRVYTKSPEPVAVSGGN